MRCVPAVFLMAMMISTADAGAEEKKQDKARYMLGIGYRSGSFSPALTFGSVRPVNAGTMLVFGEIRSKRGYAYGETNYLGRGGLPLGNHALGAHGALIRLFGFSIDAGFDYRYLSEPATVFESGDTRMDSVRRQHSALLSLGGRWGSYEGFYIRYHASMGVAHVENGLDLFVDGTFVRTNISDVDSGVIQLYGSRTEAGFVFRRFRMRGGVMQYFAKDAPEHMFPDVPIFFGAVSYTTPWHVGLYAQAMTTANSDAQHLTFLNDTVTFGVTFVYP